MSEQQSAPELLPCPFCGRESKIDEFFIDDDPMPWYAATCVICPVKTYDQVTPELAAQIWDARVRADVDTGEATPKPLPPCPHWDEIPSGTTIDLLDKLGHALSSITSLMASKDCKDVWECFWKLDARLRTTEAERCGCGHIKSEHGGIDLRYCHVCPAGKCDGFASPIVAGPTGDLISRDRVDDCHT